MKKIKSRQKRGKESTGMQKASSPDIRVSGTVDDTDIGESQSPIFATSETSVKVTKVTGKVDVQVPSSSELTVPSCGGRKIRSSSYCIGDYEGLLSMVNPSLQKSAIASLGTSASIAVNCKNDSKGNKCKSAERRSLSVRDGLSITSSIVLHPPEYVEVIDPTRETWNKKVDFLLSVIGFAVDLANVWRFPYLCYKNGGGAFLIPFAIMLAVGGVPLFFMELALGQYHRKGAITCWGRIVPAFKGIGYAVVLIAFYVDFYYNVIIAWSLYYFIHSFSSILPWTTCTNQWNSPECKVSPALNASRAHLAYGESNATGKSVSPAEEYFNRGLLELHQSTGIEGLGTIKWDVALCLAAVYVICYFSLWKGISTSGKVVWFTALFPYVVLMILLIRGITLPGAGEGIKYYLTPNFAALKHAEVWVDAATQVFFSLGPGFGVLLAFASYNRFNNNVYRDALLTSAINSATSFLAGFVIFSVLGYMAHQNNIEVKDVAAEGPGLVFIVYPEAISTFPGAPFFSLMFFLMLLTLGLDSSFGGSEAIITGLSDEFPIIKRNREIFVALLFTLYFIVGLASCAQGGVYVVELLDRYAASYSMLFAVLCETIAVSWIYGLKRFSADIKAMLGHGPGWWWKFCWLICAPVFLMVIIGYGLYEYKPLTYGSYTYPPWANVLGLMIAGSSVACIPIGAIIQFARAPGDTFKQKLRYILTPVPPVFIPTNDVSELLSAVAAASTSGAKRKINVPRDINSSSNVNKFNSTNYNVSNSSTSNSSHSLTVPSHEQRENCSDVNYLNVESKSLDQDEGSADRDNVNTDFKHKVKRDECNSHISSAERHNTTVMINPSISFDSTQV